MNSEETPVIKDGDKGYNLLTMTNCLIIGDMPTIPWIDTTVQFSSIFRNIHFYTGVSSLMSCGLTTQKLRDELTEYDRCHKTSFNSKTTEVIDGNFSQMNPPELSYTHYDGDFSDTIAPSWQSGVKSIPTTPMPHVIVVFACDNPPKCPNTTYSFEGFIKHASNHHIPILTTTGDVRHFEMDLHMFMAGALFKQKITADAAKLSAALKTVTEERDKYKSLCEGYDILTADASNG